jgi:hypothetical protein
VTNLFDRPGEKFGTAHHRERDIIRAHLDRRFGPVQPHSWEFFHREQRVNAIQRRLHKYDETFAVRSRRWAEQQRQRCIREATGDDLRLTWEELERVIEHFAGANDPVSAEIGRKASDLASKRRVDLESSREG